MAKIEKLDLHKEHKADYAASKKTPALVDVSPACYLAIAGQGEPGGEAFTAKVADDSTHAELCGGKHPGLARLAPRDISIRPAARPARAAENDPAIPRAQAISRRHIPYL